MVPTVEFLKKWDESRIMPMIQESGLTDKLTSTYKRNSQHGGHGNAMGRKSWFGGRLDTITFAQLNQLRNMSYQVIIIEDAEELTNTAQRSDQGNIKKVAFARTKAYTGRRKILDISTPIDREFSHIYREFLKGDQRYYYIECPDCGHSQRLEWKHLKFEHNEHGHIIKDSVYYECQGNECDYHILDQDKADFLPCEEMGGTAKWVPHNAEKAAALDQECLHARSSRSQSRPDAGRTTSDDQHVRLHQLLGFQSRRGRSDAPARRSSGDFSRRRQADSKARQLQEITTAVRQIAHALSP